MTFQPSSAPARPAASSDRSALHPPRPPARGRRLLSALLVSLSFLVAAPGAGGGPGEWRALGPEGGCIRQLERLADGRLLAGTCSGLLYVRDDGGTAWSRQGTGEGVVPDPEDPETLYAARGQGEALYRSEDLGRTWEQVHERLGAFMSLEMIALPGEEGPVLLWMVGGSSGGDHMWRSTDRGETLEPAGSGLPGGVYTDLAALPSEPSIVYAVAGETLPLYRSVDGGVTFVHAADGLVEGRRGAAVAIAPSRPARLYLVVRGGEVFVSDDRGDSWRFTGADLPVGLSSRVDLQVDPTDPRRVYARVNASLFVSDDGGVTFQAIRIPQVAADPEAGPWVGDYLPSPTPGRLWVALAAEAPGGVAETRDGGATWTFRDDGLLATDFTDLEPVPHEPARLYGSAANQLLVYSARTGGWETLVPRPGQELGTPIFLGLFADPGDPEHLVATTFSQIWESRDGGITWSRETVGCLSPREVAFVPGGEGELFVSGGYVLSSCGWIDECALFHRRTWDGEWTCARGEPRPNAASQLVAAPPEAGGEGGRIYAWEGSVFFRDAGETAWRSLALPPGSEGPVFHGASALAVHPYDPDVLWLGLTHGEVWRTGDHGESWEIRSPPGGWPGAALLDDLYDPFLPTPVQQIRVDPVDPRRLYVLTGGRVFGSDDGGGEWTLLSEGLPARPVDDLELDPADPATLYAAVDAVGAWKLDRLLPTEPCVADGRTLCLGSGGRFRVQARWRDFEDRVGAGRGEARTEQTGTFWFFDEANTELVVKVLDGRPVNDFWWVFYASLSNVPYTLVVTDTETGQSVGYANPAGRFASRGDTAAFPEGGPENPPPAAPQEPPLRSFVVPAPCVPGPQVLCLADGRFRVRATWEDFSGGTGTATPIPVSSGGGDGGDADTGYLWFFAPGNYELAVKVIDGRPVNGHWWVFYGSLSNVGYTLEVTDTATGEVLEYVNPSGDFGSRGDTAAFGEVP